MITRTELERFILDDLPDDRMADVRRKLAVDPALQSRADRLRAELDDLIVPPLTPPWEAKAAGFPRWASFAGVGAFLALAAAVLVFVNSGPSNTVAFRGAPFELTVHQVRAGDTREVGGIIEGQAGDRLQFTIETAEDLFVTVFDIQDDGAVETWMPSRSARAGQPVHTAVLLDDYAGSQKVFVVTSAREITADDVRAGLAHEHERPVADLDALPGLKGTSQHSVLITP